MERRLHRTPRLPALLVALSCALAAPSARAAPDDPGPEDRQAAAREFAEAQRAFGAGDFKLAAEQFEAAYKHKPHHASLWNAARARQRMGDTAKAANLYARYLREAPPNARDRNTAISSLQKLTPKLGQLEITSVGLEDVKVDREPALDRNVYVNPGAHVVEAKVVGQDRVVTQAANVDAGQTQSVALVAPTTETKATTTPTPTPTPTPVTPPTPDPTPEKSRGWSPAVVYVGLGLTVVAGGLGVLSGLDVVNQKSTFDKDPTQTNLDTGKSKQLRTNILLGVTAGLGVLTGVAAIWLVDWHSKDRSVQVGTGFGDVRFRGTF
jgi:Flp pilus assembly protein TadG